MKIRNMKWISFVTVLVMMLTLLAPMALAEELAPDMILSEKPADSEMTTDEFVYTDGAAEDLKAEDAVAKDDAAQDGAATDDATEYDAPKMIFEPLNFVKNLNYMGLGMLGIFIVIGVIIIATALLNKLFKDKKED